MEGTGDDRSAAVAATLPVAVHATDPATLEVQKRFIALQDEHERAQQALRELVEEERELGQKVHAGLVTRCELLKENIGKSERAEVARELRGMIDSLGMDESQAYLRWKAAREDAEAAKAKARKLRAALQKTEALLLSPKSSKKKKKQAMSSSSSSSSSSDGGDGGGDDKAAIKKILKGVSLEDKQKDLAKAGFTTLKKCKDLTHSDLRGAGMALFGQRDKMIMAFKEYKPRKSSRSRSKSKSRKRKGSSSSSSSSKSSGSSSSSSSNGGGDDKAAIKKILKSVDMDTHARALAKEGFTTIKKCKDLTHADLRRVGIALFGQRDRLITAFRDYKRSSSKKSKKHDKSSSSSDDEQLLALLTDLHLQKYYRPMADQGFGTLAACKNISHAELRSCNVMLFGERDKIITAIKKASTSDGRRPSRSRSGSGTRGRSGSRTRSVRGYAFTVGDYVRYKGYSHYINRGEIGTITSVLYNNKFRVRFGSGRAAKEEEVPASDLAVSYEAPRRKKKFGCF